MVRIELGRFHWLMPAVAPSNRGQVEHRGSDWAERGSELLLCNLFVRLVAIDKAGRVVEHTSTREVR